MRSLLASPTSARTCSGPPPNPTPTILAPRWTQPWASSASRSGGHSSVSAKRGKNSNFQDGGSYLPRCGISPAGPPASSLFRATAASAGGTLSTRTASAPMSAGQCRRPSASDSLLEQLALRPEHEADPERQAGQAGGLDGGARLVERVHRGEQQQVHARFDQRLGQLVVLLAGRVVVRREVRPEAVLQRRHHPGDGRLAPARSARGPRGPARRPCGSGRRGGSPAPARRCGPCGPGRGRRRGRCARLSWNVLVRSTSQPASRYSTYRARTASASVSMPWPRQRTPRSTSSAPIGPLTTIGVGAEARRRGSIRLNVAAPPTWQIGARSTGRRIALRARRV